MTPLFAAKVRKAGDVFQNVEQALAVLGDAIFTCQRQRFLGQQPPGQGVGSGGVHIHVRNGVAVSIGKGGSGIYGNDRKGCFYL